MENETKVDETITPSENEVTLDPSTETPDQTPKSYSEDDFKKVVARAKRAEAQVKDLKAQPPKVVTKTNLEVGDFIDISASLEGLDAREKSFLAEQHKLTGKPLKEIKNSEDFSLWQSAYRAKVERDLKSLPPSTRQPETPESLTLEQKLERANSLPNPVEGMKEKERIFMEAGLLDSTPKWRSDRTTIGLGR